MKEVNIHLVNRGAFFCNRVMATADFPRVPVTGDIITLTEPIIQALQESFIESKKDDDTLEKLYADWIHEGKLFFRKIETVSAVIMTTDDEVTEISLMQP